MSDSPSLQSKDKPQIAVLGYCMELPCMSDMSGDDLVHIMENKEVVFGDYLDNGICLPHQYADDDPWIYQHRKGNKFGDMRHADFTLLQISEKEFKFMSEIQMHVLSIVWKGLETSGIPISLLHKTRTGIFAAAYQVFGGFQSYPDETALRGGLMSSMSDRVAYFLGTHGPTLTVETACSSSLVALSLAVDSIRNGACDVAIVVTANVGSLEYELALQATGVISKNGECRPFDEDASGTLRCDGLGCMIICSMDWAKKNGYTGTIKSVIVNSVIGSAGADPKATHGSGRVYESPNVAGMAEMIRLCHDQAGLPLEKVQYVEAHATGTKVGDLVELEALSDVYRNSHDIQRNPLRVGSLKGNIGHAELSAGMFSLIKAIEMIRKRRFFPTGGQNITPRKDFDWKGNNIKLCQESEAFPPGEQIYIGVNSFGVGGSYAHVVVTEYKEDDGRMLKAADSLLHSALNRLLFTVSAASTRHLDQYEEDILKYLETHPGDISLLDLCGLFAVNRPKLSWSRSYVVDTIDELIDQLASRSKKHDVSEGSKHQHTIAMAFTGQGSQWVLMGSGLMIFKAYRDIVTRFDALYRKFSGWSLLDKLTAIDDNQLADTMYAQPLTFMVQIGLIELLRYFGVRPSIAFGHSAGEIAALYCCGLLSLEDSAAVVFHRSQCQQALAGCGRMLAVQMDSADAKLMLRDPSLRVSNCEIACINSPSSVVIAGPQSELEKIQCFLSNNQVKNTFLKGNMAFHCSIMDSILPEIDRKLDFLNRRKVVVSDTRFLSSVTSLPLTVLSSEYIVHNIRQPVRFHETITYLLNQYDPSVIVEVGPHKTLAPLLVECVQAANQQAHVHVLTSLSKNGDDVRSFWHLMTGLINLGISVDTSRFYRDIGYDFSRVADKRIPRHPFISQKFSQWLFRKENHVAGKRDIGPASGTLVSEDSSLVSVVEISRATSLTMTEHVHGGIAMLPGMYFVEAAIETWGLGHDDCLSMSDVIFHEMCPIPDRSKIHDTRKLFVRHAADKSERLTSFTVESRPMESMDVTVHCSGSLVSFDRPDAFDGSQYIPGPKGLRQKRSATRDIGQRHLQDLLDSHYTLSSAGKVYTMINEDGVTEYGKSFKVIDEVKTSADGSSIVATLRFDHETWMSKGGIYGVQLLDGILQLSYLNPYIASGNVGYAGGFDLGIFVRKPVENPCIVHFQFAEDNECFGQTVVHGDALMYDSRGMLLCHLIGIRSIIGKRTMGISDGVPVWQPMSMPNPSHGLAAKARDKRGSDSPIIETIVNLLHKKKSYMQSGACHLRILEFWEDVSSIPVVFEALIRVDQADLPECFNFLVEVFIVAYDDSVLKKGYHIPPKHKNWLRLRLVSLPSAQESLDLFCFDVIAAWRHDSKQTRWDNPMDLLHLANRLGYHGSILLHDLDIGEMWKGYVEDCNDHPSGFSSCTLGSSIPPGEMEVNQSVFVISKDSNNDSRLHECLSQFISSNRTQTKVKTCSIECGDKQCICKIAAEISGEPGEKHVVFLDGMVDESNYAQDTFTLVARIAYELGELRCKCYLWVVTRNAFVPPIKVHRNSLLRLVMGLNMTIRNIHAKFVDLGGPIDALPALILSKPGPQQFMINNAGIVHQRMMLPPEIASPPKKLLLHADDSDMYYKCDLVKLSQSNKTRNYDFFAQEVRQPGPGEVLVDIHYASLNFRDIMLTLNALPRSSFEASYYGYNLGMEGSGTIVKVGDGVRDLASGDHVIVSGKGTIASKLTASQDSVFKFDSSKITMKDAACILSVYSTAYHALIDLCQLKKGDRVLIHAAAGGVGHAAISLCSHMGAEIYATTSHTKREYCVDVLGVPQSRVFNSRDVSWFDDLMRATGDEGVDVVLNSLAGEHQCLGIQCLRPGGRFCEIGKADIFNNEKLFLFAFRKNIKMFAIDMDRMSFDDPDKANGISKKVLECISRGDYKVLPSTCFPMDKIKDAIELMKSGSHIGKVVLSNYIEGRALAIPSNNVVHCDEESYHLVLGGAGGFGSKIVRWLFTKGARKFITTVSKDPSRIKFMFEDLIADGVVFEVIEADLSNENDLEKIARLVTNSPVLGHVETMVHCAGIYEPFYYDNDSDDSLKRQCDIKVRSALFLDNLSRKLGSVKRFIIVGSNSAEATMPYFEAYAASNAILASVGRKRLDDGLPATILQMGSLKDVGIVAKDQTIIEYQNKAGTEFMNSARALMAFDAMLSDSIDEVVQVNNYPHRLIANLGTGWIGAHLTPVEESLMMFGEAQQSLGSTYMTFDLILERLIWLIADTMGIEQGSASASTSFTNLGVDSMAMMEVRQHIQDEFNYSIDRSAFSMTIGDLAKDIHKKWKRAEASHSEVEHHAVEVADQNVQPAAEEIANPQDETKYIGRNYNVKNPKGYVLVVPGADQNGLYFADWKLDDIQILHVTLHGSPFVPKFMAKLIAEELYSDGYLKDQNTNIVILGYSFGSFIGLELCKELLDTYAFQPTGLIPICFAAPQACMNRLDLLPKVVRSAIVSKKYRDQVKREYGEPDPDDTLVYSVYMQRPSNATLVKWEEEGQRYFKDFMRSLKGCQGKFLGNTPIHYVYATKDQIGNPKRVSDPEKHGWGELTSGPFEISPWYGKHSSLVHPIVGTVFRGIILDIIINMIE